MDSLQGFKEISEDPITSNSALFRYGKFFVAKIKENLSWSNSFKDIFANEEKFMMKMNTNKFSDIALGLLQFIMEILGKPLIIDEGIASKGSLLLSKSAKLSMMNLNPDKIKISSTADDDYSKIYSETQNLVQTISMQKQKIENMYETVKSTVGITKSISSTPNFSRPGSQNSINRLSPEINVDSPKSANFLFERKK